MRFTANILSAPTLPFLRKPDGLNWEEHDGYVTYRCEYDESSLWTIYHYCGRMTAMKFEGMPLAFDKCPAVKLTMEPSSKHNPSESPLRLNIRLFDGFYKSSIHTKDEKLEISRQEVNPKFLEVMLDPNIMVDMLEK